MSSQSKAAAGAITLPKGGGALRGIGESFSPDLHTGTGNYSIPLPLPPGRNGLQPQLTLQYSTGAGNGPFGLGWSLGVPSVTRKTSRGVPRYRDGAADRRVHDTFVLAGSEDLVPVGGGAPGVVRYRPRTEGGFARIERHPDRWEVHARDGMVGRYGGPQPGDVGRAVVADPAAPGRVWEWKLTETTDPFGNRVVYEYRRDRGSDAHHHWDQLYLHRVRYVDFEEDGETRFLVSVELEYGERPDPFSDGRAGFEVRTRLRCSRIVVRTHAGEDRTFRSYRLVYLDERPELAHLLPHNGVSLLSEVRVTGHDGERTESLPPLQLGYTRFQPETRDFLPLEGRDLPEGGLASPQLELVDLFGRGLPDLLETRGDSVRYWRNLGGGRFDLPRAMSTAPAGVALGDAGVQLLDANGDGRSDLLVSRPGAAGYFPLHHRGEWDRRSFRPYATAPTFDLRDPEVRMVDLDGDGVTDAIRSGSRLECFFNDPREGWSETRQVERRALELFPDVRFSDERVRFADMTGDGLQDMVLLHDGNVEYWPAHGWGDWGRRVSMRGSPRLPRGYDPRRVLLGDVDGDGAADLVYVDDTRVTLWINRCGNGWSEPVVITGTPPLADADGVRLVDLMGTGIAGILWSTGTAARRRDRYMFLQLSGEAKPYLLNRMDNRMGSVVKIEYAPSTRYYLADQADPATRWRTTLPFPVQVVARTVASDAVSGGRLVTEYTYRHGYWDGAEREFRGFARVDRRDTESFERFRATAAAATLAAVDPGRFSPPLETRSWFHLGPVGEEHGDWAEPDFRDEFWAGDAPAFRRPHATARLLRELPRRARRDAVRALRGRLLRTELYALDGSERAGRPFTVTETLHDLREEDAPDPDGPDRERIFFPFQAARRTTEWDRGDDPATQLEFTDDHDAFGQPRSRLGVAVPRGRDWRVDDPAAAEPYLATLTVTRYAAPGSGRFIADRAARVTTWEVVGERAPSAFALRERVLAGAAAREIIGETLNFYDGAAFTGLPAGTVGGFGALSRSETLVLTRALLREGYRSGDAVATPPEEPPYLAPEGAPAWTPEYPDEFRALTRPLAGYVYRPAGPDSAEGYFAAAGRRYDFQEGAGAGRGLLAASRDALGNVSTLAYDAYGLLPVRTVDAVGVATAAEYDYRVLQARLVTDANGNRTAHAYTPLGLLESTAVMGKEGEARGDTPAEPGSRHVYDFGAFMERGEPISVRTVRRVHHATDADVPAAERGDALEAVEFTDGFGRLVQTRTLAEDVRFGEAASGNGLLPLDPADPGGAVEGEPRGAAAPPRVVVSGWQTYDNKGRVVEKHEPFFSSGWSYAPPGEAELGQKVTTGYDARGRPVRTVSPDGSERRVVYGVPASLSDPDVFVPTPWEACTYDVNDNAGRTHPAGAGVPASHHDTPTSAAVDALGRTVLTVERGGPDPAEWRVTRVSYDVRGNPLATVDALGRTVSRQTYDLADQPIRVESLDAGARRTVRDASGGVVEERDARGSLALSAYDAGLRPVRLWARDAAGTPVTLRERRVYGDSLPDAQALPGNLRGRLHRHYDEAGLVVVEAYDFRGNLAEKVRFAISDAEVLTAFDPKPSNGYRVDPYRVQWEPPRGRSLDAHAARLLDPTEYRTSLTHDALGRVRTMTYPRAVDGVRRTLRPRYNRAGALERVEMDGTTFVERIAYNARGQRTLVAYGSGVMTRYAYHPLTFRLARLRTDRYARPAEAPLRFAPTHPAKPVQDLSYAYDLVGSLLRIEDRTPASGVVDNPEAALVDDPVLAGLLAAGNALLRRFEYDPLYRLRSATGRQCKTIPAPWPWADEARCESGFQHLGTPAAENAPNVTSTYRELYDYDPAGNLVRRAHLAAGASWTRHFGVGGRTPEQWAAEWPQHADGAPWAGAPGNRLTHAGDDAPAAPQTHAYDAAGNLVRETTSRHFGWDHAGRLQLFRVQAEGARPTVYAYYLYGAEGERVKKVVGRQGSGTESTVLVDGVFEHHRAGPHANDTLHVMDDAQRIATVRVGSPLPGDNSPAVLYHLADHLGSSAATLDGAGELISREEYTPHGETTLGSFTRKRYRFTGRERDEESGLSHHGARYYAPWLARWASPDPAGLVDGTNPYVYVRNAPTRWVDPSGLSGVAPPPEAIAEQTGVQALEKKYSTAGKVTNITPEKHVNANGVDAHLVVGEGKGAVNVVGDVKYSEKPGPKNAWEVTSFDAAKADEGAQLRKNIVNARKAGLLDKETARAAYEGAKSGTEVIEDVVVVGSNKDVSKPLKARQVAVTKVDTFPHIAEKVKDKEIRAALKSLPKPPSRTARALGHLGRAGKRFGAAIPVVGSVIGYSSTAHAAATGDVQGAALDTVGHVPIAGDLVDAGRGGYAVGEAINEFIPEDVQNAIGGTINEIVNEGGWKELFRHPFGIGM